jgi:hypothetical protein
MDLVLVAVLGVTVWLAIALIAIAICLIASRADARAEGTAGLAPVPPRRRPAGVPAV